MTVEDDIQGVQGVSDEVRIHRIWALGITLSIAVIVISIPWSISYCYSSIYCEAIKNGYEQSTLPGKTGVYWVAPDRASQGEVNVPTF